MTDNIGVYGISIISGAVLAVQDLPGGEVADKIGMAGIAVMVIWWMLNSFSKRLDALTAAIERLVEKEK